MEIYIGVKIIKAKPMTLGEYNKYRGWDIPENENPSKEGCLVEYMDSPDKNHDNHENYISWSPRDAFKKAYSKSDGLPFGLAIEAIRKGKKVCRKGWNGKGMFVYYVAASSYPVSRNYDSAVKGLFANDMVPYRAYMALKTAQNDIATWAPSGSDALAEDWMIID